MGEIGRYRRFWSKIAKFWPTLAEPDVHDIIPVEDPKCSLYIKNGEKRACRLGEIEQNGRF